ncbi:MAG TPA: hypothetical protein VGB91_05760 [Rhizomicrobium sp.]
MKCLGPNEVADQLLPKGFSINTNRHVVSAWMNDLKYKVAAKYPVGQPATSYFANRLVSWIQTSQIRMLWLTNWETRPPNCVAFFDLIRSAHHENRFLSDAPGHVFDAADTAVGEDGLDDGLETVTIAGMILLLICYNWEGYLLGLDTHDVIYVGDSTVEFFSLNSEKIADASQIVKLFGGDS